MIKKADQPHIVVIGGGTGSYTLLCSLKNWTNNLTAIVNMSDNGGSSGLLRDELGVLPPGDIRQCIVALSSLESTRDILSYRFSKGSLAGHSLGNIILSAVELKTGSFSESVEVISKLFAVTGQVLPVSSIKHSLVLEDGTKQIVGESQINNHFISSPNARLSLRPKAKINPRAKQAILKADLVVVAPGNLYCSILPTLIVEGMSQALKQTKAKVVLVANLVNKPKQTANWRVSDYVNKVEEYTGSQTIDVVLYNNKLPSKRLLNKYSDEGELPVIIDEANLAQMRQLVVGADFVDRRPFKIDPADKLIKRTLIRHNASEITKQLKKLLD